MTVEFRLLGDVAVGVDGRQVDLGHARQRGVLAALLVEANRGGTGRAAAGPGVGRPTPETARNALSGYVSRLRRSLADTAEARFIRQAGGYRLAVDPLAVDLHLFRHLLTRARSAADDEALELFERALGLWRGQAFAAVDTPWLTSLRATLEAERLAAELDRNDVALRLGQHTSILSRLSTWAAAHPLDERVSGQLMLALYRCGRQADTLRAYERIRAALAEELGTDPGPPLRELHRRVLTADPTLAAPAPPGPPVPRQLPAPPGPFTGRVDALDRLDAIMDGAVAVTIAAVLGTAGVGKTALALHWANRVADRFPCGQLYADLRGFDPHGTVTSPTEVLRTFLDALGVPPQRVPAGQDAQIGLYRSLLAGRRMLIVLDNARDIDINSLTPP